jgi:hypothetical protein
MTTRHPECPEFYSSDRLPPYARVRHEADEDDEEEENEDDDKKDDDGDDDGETTDDGYSE